MSRSSKGKPKSKLHAKRIGDALRGKPKSPEHIAKFCGANSPAKRPEVAAKLSKSRKAAWKDPKHRAVYIDAFNTEENSARLSKNNHERWKNHAYKKRVGRAISKAMNEVIKVP